MLAKLPKKRKKVNITPYGIVGFTTFFSFLMWILPDFNRSLRKGFFEYFPVSFNGVICCTLWLLSIVFFSYIGFQIVQKLNLSFVVLNKKAPIESYRVIRLLTILGIIGVVYVAFGILKILGMSGVLHAITAGEANTLKDTLYSDYRIGFASLRYMSIPAAALGIYHIYNRRFLLTSIVSIISLLIVSIISSRLSIVYTIFILISLLYLNSEIKIKKFHVIIGFLSVIHLIFFLNYTRNINFYRNIGVDNFYAAGISEVITYVGSPFQGFLAAGSLGNVLSGKGEESTHPYTGISIELSTNSAFLELLRQTDLIQAFLLISISTLIGSFLMALALKNKKNIIGLLFGIVGYCFAEIWRVFLFGQGIVYTLVIIILLIAVLFYFIPEIKWRKYR